MVGESTLSSGGAGRELRVVARAGPLQGFIHKASWLCRNHLEKFTSSSCSKKMKSSELEVKVRGRGQNRDVFIHSFIQRVCVGAVSELSTRNPRGTSKRWRRTSGARRGEGAALFFAHLDLGMGCPWCLDFPVRDVLLAVDLVTFHVNTFDGVLSKDISSPAFENRIHRTQFHLFLIVWS